MVQHRRRSERFLIQGSQLAQSFLEITSLDCSRRGTGVGPLDTGDPKSQMSPVRGGGGAHLGDCIMPDSVL